MPAALPPGLRAAFNRPLDAGAIAASLGSAGAEVEAVQETGSTSVDLMQRARVRAPTGDAVWLRCALAQRDGRGRLGRRWFAAPGSGLLFSVAFPLKQAQPPAGVTLSVGAALADELEALLDFAGAPLPEGRLQLKWPNDLLLTAAGRRAKLGGVLTELAVDRAGAHTLVVGVGINVWLDAAARDSIGQPAAALEAVAPLPAIAAEREHWLGRLAAATVRALRATQDHGFVPQQAQFMLRFADLNQRVELREHDTRVAQGRAVGIDGEGRLLLEIDGRLQHFASGELSVRVMGASA